MTDSTTAAPATIQARDRIIVALDVERADDARRIVSETRPFAGGFKIGLQLFTSAGPEFVREMCDSGQRVFLDLKFHDIPNTVAKAGIEAARLGVWMFNVHALGGNEMMRQAVYEMGEFCERESVRRPKIIAVTILTSSSDDALRDIGIEASVEAQVLRLARLARKSGLDGVVASAAEAGSIRSDCGVDFAIVTPGVRPKNASNFDQKRVMTPSDAIRAGADYLVVGRPITASQNMAAAADGILKEISSTINE
jgi:orotidine-5'-phosphate decarboxylase